MYAADFTLRVKSIIAGKGIKHKFIAEKMGITDRKLSDILNGRKTIDIELIMLFCNALEISPNEILGFKAEQRS